MQHVSEWDRFRIQRRIASGIDSSVDGAKPLIHTERISATTLRLHDAAQK